MIYCLLGMLANHIWQHCWDILKFMYLIENSGFLAEDSNFSSAQESKIFWLNQKTPTQNSTRRWGDCHGPPFSECPLFRAGWGGRISRVKNERGTATRWVSEMLHTLGRGVGISVQITAEKGENCYSKDSFMMQYIWQRARSFSFKASSDKRFSRSVKETIFLWLLEGLLPRCCSHKCWGSGIEGASAGKKLAYSTVIFTNGSKLASHRQNCNH